MERVLPSLDVKSKVRSCVRCWHSRDECPPRRQAHRAWQLHAEVTKLLTRPSVAGFWLWTRGHEYLLYHAARLTGVP
eukprot:3220349-Pleurochrysis_carterae.AAC.1